MTLLFLPASNYSVALRLVTETSHGKGLSFLVGFISCFQQQENPERAIWWIIDTGDRKLPLGHIQPISQGITQDIFVSCYIAGFLLKICIHEVPSCSHGHFFVDFSAYNCDLTVLLTHLYPKTWINANKGLQVLGNLVILISTTQPVFGSTINKSDSSFT